MPCIFLLWKTNGRGWIPRKCMFPRCLGFGLQGHFITIVCNIDQYVLATLLTFSCYFSITYNCLWKKLLLHPAPPIVCPPLSIKMILKNNVYTMSLVPTQYRFIVFWCIHVLTFFKLTHIDQLFEQNYLYLFKPFNISFLQ